MLDGKLSGLKQPVLIVWGREDGLTPLAREGERFRHELPSAQFVVFDQHGERVVEGEAIVLAPEAG